MADCGFDGREITLVVEAVIILKSRMFRLWVVLSLSWMVLYGGVYYGEFIEPAFAHDPPIVFASYLVGLPIIGFLLIYANGRLSGWLRLAVVLSGVWLIGWLTVGRMIYDSLMIIPVENCAMAGMRSLGRVYGVKVDGGDCPDWIRRFDENVADLTGLELLNVRSGYIGLDHLAAVAILGAVLLAIAWIILFVSRWIKQAT